MIFNKIIGICCLGLVCIQVLAQAQTITGIVKHDVSLQPVADAEIFLLSIPSKTVKTDGSGRFVYEIPSGEDLPEKFEVSVNHPNFGYFTFIQKPPITSHLELLISKNNKVSIKGTVFDFNNKRYIPGIRISISSESLAPGYESPQTVTDEFGRFQIVIDKTNFQTKTDHVDLILVDPSRTYPDHKERVKITETIDIILEGITTPAKSKYLSKQEILQAPNYIYFIYNFDTFKLVIENNFMGLPYVNITRIDFEGDRLIIYYDYFNGRIEGTINDQGVYEGEYGNGLGHGTFRMQFNEDGTSSGSYRTKGSIISKSGAFNLIKP